MVSGNLTPTPYISVLLQTCFFFTFFTFFTWLPYGCVIEWAWHMSVEWVWHLHAGWTWHLSVEKAWYLSVDIKLEQIV